MVIRGNTVTRDKVIRREITLNPGDLFEHRERLDDIREAAQREKRAQEERAQAERKATEEEKRRREDDAERERQAAEAERKRQQEEAAKDRRRAEAEQRQADDKDNVRQSHGFSCFQIHQDYLSRGSVRLMARWWVPVTRTSPNSARIVSACFCRRATTSG